MTDPLVTAALERFRAACDDGRCDEHPDVSVPRKHRRDYAHLAPWLDAAERWSWRRERRR
jgi:hypothetical protein